MSFRKTLKTIAITLVLTTTSMPMAGQDLIAKMAPVDRKVKALDTLALSTIRERENMDSPSADLYSDWDNRFAHKVVGGVVLAYSRGHRALALAVKKRKCK